MVRRQPKDGSQSAVASAHARRPTSFHVFCIVAWVRPAEEGETAVAKFGNDLQIFLHITHIRAPFVLAIPGKRSVLATEKERSLKWRLVGKAFCQAL